MSYNKSLFQGVPKKRANKSRFNLSHEWKSQAVPGKIIPCCRPIETMPGDEFELSSELLFRFAPLYFPMMQKMTLRVDYFFVPNRILWPEQTGITGGWTKWIAEMTEEEHPIVNVWSKQDGNYTSWMTSNFFGLPVIPDGEDYVQGIIGVNAFPFSAYLKIWDEYYRIPQLEDEVWFPLEPGLNTVNMTKAFNRGTDIPLGEYPAFSSKWEKDYFTSALPTPQLGDPIQIPMVNFDDPIAKVDSNDQLYYSPYPSLMRYWALDKDGEFFPADNQTSAQSVVKVHGSDSLSPDFEGRTGVSSAASNNPVPTGLDIQETAATIKQLRIAETLQAYYERLVKIGQRYRDYIQGMFGNDPQPGLVDVPVLIGSKFGYVQVSDVMTQALTQVDGGRGARPGDYAGQQNLYERASETFRYNCQEHGFILILMQVNPNTSYGNGVDRFWRRSVQTDYPLDIFSGIGDQEILKEEVYFNPLTAQQDKNFGTFGYIPRFSEMRYMNNLWANRMNTGLGLSMHLGRTFDIEELQDEDTYDNVIEINQNFTEVTPRMTEPGKKGGIRFSDAWTVLPSKNWGSDPSEGIMFCHVFHSIYVNRALPMFSTPGESSVL